MGGVADHLEDFTTRVHHWHNCLVPFLISIPAAGDYSAIQRQSSFKHSSQTTLDGNFWRTVFDS